MATSRNVTREEIFYKATLAEETSRYSEAANYMNELVTGWASPSLELSLKERNLLHHAYERVICPLRRACRTVSEAEKNKEARKNGDPLELVGKYRVDLEDKMTRVCAEILKLLEEILIPSASLSEARVFYLMMRGDYYRYLAEFQLGDEAVSAAMVAYKTAENIASADLPPLHPTRLGLELNHSVFYSDILNLSEEAYKMAKKAFDGAVAELSTMDKGRHYKDTLPILTLMKRNLKIWGLENYIFD